MINNKTPRLLAGIMLVVVCLLIPTRSQSDSEATPTYGEMTGNGAPGGQFKRQRVKYQYNPARAVMGIPAWNGSRWPVHFKVSSFILGAQEGYRVAFGGSPLIKTINGVLTWDPENEKTTYPLDRKTKAVSRTAACKTADNRWLYLVAARDVNVDSLLSFFGAVGCVAGMEFDGGMSTTLVYLGTVKERSVFFPVGGGRPIGTGLVVWRVP